MTDQHSNETSLNDVAIVGMAARFPGARNVDEYWHNVRQGIEAVRPFTDDELRAEGVDERTLKNPNYVKSATVLDDMEFFDAEFFGFSPKEAAIMDPQHRHFLECAWEALENAGHPPEWFDGAIGVFGGCGMGSYLTFNLLTNPELVNSVGLFLLRHTGNDKDFLSTRVSYSFNLTGPSINVQTACSTSLVAVHLACQSLLSGECDMALAGGVTIELPHRRGYMFQEGEILSPDGHCRAFDHRSQGTIFGSGVGIVTLRRLQDALAEGDHIHAVIKGSAINNDGAGKISYLAPSVDGQAAAIAEALAVADVGAETISYVESHGTGTPVGDPIEISALTQAFRETTEKSGYCGIGSVKTNIGHLDTAAGVASLIKASLALEHKQLPPSLNYEAPNPTIDFENSPFYVNDQLRDWTRGEMPRRAGVNSLGVGGTNAHVILEEPPERSLAAESTRPFQLLTISARNRAAVDDASKRLATHLREHPEQNLADVAFTLQVGRRGFDVRRVLAAGNRQEAIDLLEDNNPQRVFTHKVTSSQPSVVFMFPGGGAQYFRMGRDLYETEPVYREHVDRGLDALGSKVDFDLRDLLLADEDRRDEVSRDFERPSVQLPAIFIIEYALTRLWMSWGVEPTALIGHSMGENTAACIAGVLSFEDALGLVTLRGALFESLPEGGMLSVPLPADELKPLLGHELDLATINGPEVSAASGPIHCIECLERKLADRGIEAQRIPINIAAHSQMLEPILEEFGDYLKSIELHPPRIPFVSNRTGTWITPEQATDADYWVEHLRHTIRFADGMGTLLETPGRVLLEIGPGKILGSLARQHPDLQPAQSVISSLRHPQENVSDAAYFLAAVGRLWASGVDVDLKRLWEEEDRRRVLLPTYAFQRQRYWIDPGKAVASSGDESAKLERIEDVDDWYFHPVWKPSPIEVETIPRAGEDESPSVWLVFIDNAGIGDRLVERLERRGHKVVCVCEGDAYFQHSETNYTLSPEHGRDGYDALLGDLVASGKTPSHIVHLWLTTADESFRPGSSFFHRNQERGFYSLFFLAQAWGGKSLSEPLHLTVVSNGMQQVGREKLPYPEKATVLGPCQVIPRELPNTTCASIDVVLPEKNSRRFGGRRTADKVMNQLVDSLEAELFQPAANRIVAHRNTQRFERQYEKRSPQSPGEDIESRIRPGGVYLITGGLGGIGLVMAEHLAKTAQARLVLVGRSSLPKRDDWETWLHSHSSDNSISQKIRKVLELESCGAEVLVESADVADVEAMRRVVDAARDRFGAIHGVVHAAGVLHDGLIQLKTQSDVEDVFTPKVHGTLVLDSLFTEADLDFFVLFSSTSTATAAAGQVDYVAANAFLNAYAGSRSDGRTIAINWGLWNEVGMAANLVASNSTNATSSTAAEQPATHPLFETRIGDAHAREVVLSAKYSTATHWILDEHRTASGQALLPGTGYIELARAALAEIGVTDEFRIQDLWFLRPLYVADDESKDVRVKLIQDEQGYRFEVQSRCTLDDGRAGWESHAEANLLLNQSCQPRPVPLAEIEDRCQLNRAPEDPNGIRTKQEEHLRFGPRWRVLRRMSYGAGEALAQLELPEEFSGDLEEYTIHPALLDLATGYAMNLIEGYENCDDLWVPVSYKQVTVYRRMPRRVYSWVRSHGLNQADAEFASFDVVVTDETGNVILDVEEFSIKRLRSEEGFAKPSQPSPAELEMESNDSTQTERQLSPAEQAFQDALEMGILPAEGTKAFDRILAGESPSQVIVSSLDLHVLIRQADELAAQEEDSSTKFARPQLDSEYTEPRDDVERTMAGIWEELLGVEQVGIHDSFFDLGGHSLIAVRLFAKIKQAYNVEYPISVLFEAPTIERCAEMIRETIGEEGADRGETAAAHRPRFTHLVPMHPTDPGPKTPFFLVAGMFGNVLNLRHLAHLIGADRPFYGLQARGLYGEHAPHETFEQMTADYLAELRSVQPEGPYLLGGFSGGGITAFEMAHQLLEQGEQIDLLLMLDTPLPLEAPLTSRDKFIIHCQRLRRRGIAYLTDWARNRVAWELNRIRQRFHRSSPDERLANFHSDTIEAAFRRSLSIYELRNFPGTITLFRPKLDEAHVLGPNRIANSDRELVFHDNGWGPYADHVEVHEVPGSHDSMVLEPNVRALSARLRHCIDSVETAWSDTEQANRLVRTKLITGVRSPTQKIGAAGLRQ